MSRLHLPWRRYCELFCFAGAVPSGGDIMNYFVSEASPGGNILNFFFVGVTLVDESVVVFGRIFPRAANKHKHQMIQHFKVSQTY